MKMSADKVEQSQRAVPVAVTVVATVEPPPRPPSPPADPAPPAESLGPVQCVVTAPTPRSGSPEEDSDQEKLFPITSCSSATEDDGEVVGTGGTGWTDNEHPTGWLFLLSGNFRKLPANVRNVAQRFDVRQMFGNCRQLLFGSWAPLPIDAFNTADLSVACMQCHDAYVYMYTI